MHRSVGFVGDAEEAVRYALLHLRPLVHTTEHVRRNGVISHDLIVTPTLKLPDVFDLFHHTNQVTPLLVLEAVVGNLQVLSPYGWGCCLLWRRGRLHMLMGVAICLGVVMHLPLGRERVPMVAVGICGLGYLHEEYLTCLIGWFHVWGAAIIVSLYCVACAIYSVVGSQLRVPHAFSVTLNRDRVSW